MNVEIKVDQHVLEAELNDSDVAAKLADAMPITVKLSRWGDEYYGNCEISASLADDARELMEVGEIAFWPPGSALCLFFGPTPASTDDRPRAASPVIPLGRITSDPAVLRTLGSTVEATVSRRT